MGLFIPAAAQQLFSIYCTFDPSSDSASGPTGGSGGDPGFVRCLAEHMGGALERLEGLLMGQEEINCFLNTHRLLRLAHPSLLALAYSTCGTKSSAALVLSSAYPHVTASKSSIHSAAFSLLNAAALAPQDSPEQTDLSAVIARAAVDLDIPLIAPSFHSAICPDSGAALGPAGARDVLGATLKEQTVLTVLLCPGRGSTLLERYPSLLVRAVLGEGGASFAKHGSWLALGVVQLGEGAGGGASSAAGYTVLIKLVTLVIAAVLADRGSGNTISPAVAADIVSCFVPLFAPKGESLSGTASKGTAAGTAGTGESLLLLLELNALLPLHRNLTLHTLMLSHCMRSLRGAHHLPVEDVSLALKSLPFVLSGYAAGSPRSFSDFKEEESAASEVPVIFNNYCRIFNPISNFNLFCSYFRLLLCPDCYTQCCSVLTFDEP